MADQILEAREAHKARPAWLLEVERVVADFGRYLDWRLNQAPVESPQG